MIGGFSVPAGQRMGRVDLLMIRCKGAMIIEGKTTTPAGMMSHTQMFWAREKLRFNGPGCREKGAKKRGGGVGGEMLNCEREN